MNGSIEQWELVDACDKFMESGFHKGICLDDNGSRASSLNEALADFESALEFMPHWAPILDCCAMLKFMLGEKPAAREYHIRASQNTHCFISPKTDQVCRGVWIEFMKWCIYGQPLVGNQIQIKYEETLPARPTQYQSVSCKAQVFKGDFHFGLAIERNEDKVELTLTLEHAEIGVSNFMEEDKFQGYFIHAFDIDVSPDEAWLDCSQFSTVRSVGRQTPQPPIRQEEIPGCNALFGMGGIIANTNRLLNFVYSSQTVSSFKFREVMTTSKGILANDKAMRSTWKVIRYAKVKRFAVEPVGFFGVWKFRKLPYPPTNHVCNDSVKFQGTWKVPVNIAGLLQYEFHWKIQLNAHFALLPKKSRLPFKSARQPLKYEYNPPVKMVMSDFYSISMSQMFQF